MYKQADQPQESKSKVVTNSVSQNNKAKQGFGFVDNRSKTVTQLVTYKTKEYSVPLKNISDFREVANSDLASFGNGEQARNVSRDTKMLNVIAKSDMNIESKEQLKNIIDPINRHYQASIQNELQYITPEVGIINTATDATKKETFLTKEGGFDRESASLSKIVVDENMGNVIGSVKKIHEFVQWEKLDGISVNAGAIINIAKNVVSFFNHDGGVSDKSKTAFAKKTAEITKYSDNIIRTAGSIVPELRQSADEQYLRGVVGNKPDVAGGSHLIIGKKLDTFKVMEEDQSKASGILKASVWSGGVNDAFIEGGIDSRKEFRLISDIPPELESILRRGDYDDFILLAKEWGRVESKKSEHEREKPTDNEKGTEPVWWAIWDTRKDDLTTLSKELVKLMKAGYVLV